MDPVNRRQALQRLGVLGIGAVASACGSSNGGNAATATPTASATQPPTASPTPPPTVAPSFTPTRSVTSAPSATASPTPSDTPPPSATATAPPSATPTASPSPSPTVTPEQIDCILSPTQTLGPYFIDAGLARADIREDRAGVPLRLALQVVNSNDCTPIRDAVVNVWHADATGAYSGFAGQPGGVDTRGQTYLRGFQVSDADGRVEFTTIYPGWYVGRTIHIHVRIHLDATTLLVTQVYFPEDVTAQVQTQEPYASEGPSDTDNDEDGIFDELLVMNVAAEGDGFVAAMVIGIDR